uniref:Uncharacterized protein n=1 Tax=Tectiviridae sp. TaxID=2831614 RepID=A0A8S5VXZ7_9VIRU|nr:MAG TPA: hypothetical protein [Tectiviridae sp.]
MSFFSPPLSYYKYIILYSHLSITNQKCFD